MSQSTIKPSNTNDSMSMGFHFASVLTLVANQYRSLREAVLEALQNGLDAGAKKINVNINQEARNIFVQDDGCGASIEHMRKCLSEVAKSQKERGKLGQFGIGVVASFGKCKRFTFQSRPKNKSNGMRRWVFDCATLAKSTGNGVVPCLPVAEHAQWWNSELAIESYTKDQLKAALDFDEFCTAIYDRYGAAMLRNKTTIYVKLTTPDGKYQEAALPPMDFTGHPLPVQTYDSPHCGKTTIRLFIVSPDPNSKKRKGQGVRLMDSTGYTLPMSEKVFQGTDGRPLLSKKDVDIFKHGLFEGEIIFSDKVKLDPSRKFFEESMTTLHAVAHIEQWLSDHGRELVEQLQDEETAERYRRLGDQSLRVFGQFLKEDRNESLLKLIRGFNWGSQGLQHSANSAELNGTVRGKAIQGGGNHRSPDPTKKKQKNSKTHDPDREPKDRPGHVPLTVGDPDGAPRVRSRHDSTGLELRFERGGNDLWKFDKTNGVIRINVAHPTWVANDRLEGSTQNVRDYYVCQLQEYIILHALLSLKLSDDLGMSLEDIFCLYAHEFEEGRSFLVTKGDKLVQRGRYQSKRKADASQSEGA